MKKGIGKKLFCLALVLAMVIGTIGVQKVKVSAMSTDSDEYRDALESYIYVSIDPDTEVLYARGDKNNYEAPNVEKAKIDFDSIEVKVCYDNPQYVGAYDNNELKMSLCKLTNMHGEIRIVYNDLTDGYTEPKYAFVVKENSIGTRENNKLTTGVYFQYDSTKVNGYFLPAPYELYWLKNSNMTAVNNLSDWNNWLTYLVGDGRFVSDVTSLRFPADFKEIVIKANLIFEDSDRTTNPVEFSIEKNNILSAAAYNELSEEAKNEVEAFVVDDSFERRGINIKRLSKDDSNSKFTVDWKVKDKNVLAAGIYLNNKIDESRNSDAKNSAAKYGTLKGWRVYTAKDASMTYEYESEYGILKTTENYIITKPTLFSAVLDEDDDIKYSHVDVKVPNGIQFYVSTDNGDYDEKIKAKVDNVNSVTLKKGDNTVMVLDGIGRKDQSNEDEYGFVTNKTKVTWGGSNNPAYNCPGDEFRFFLSEFDKVVVNVTFQKGDNETETRDFEFTNDYAESYNDCKDEKSSDDYGLDIILKVYSKEYSYQFFDIVNGTEAAIEYFPKTAVPEGTILSDNEIPSLQYTSEWDKYELNDSGEYKCVHWNTEEERVENFFKITAPTKFIAKYAHEDATITFEHYYTYTDAADNGHTDVYTTTLSGNAANNWQDGGHDIHIGAKFSLLDSDKKAEYKGVTYEYKTFQQDGVDVITKSNYKVMLFYTYDEPSNGGNGGSNYVFIPIDDGPKDDPKDDVKEEPVVEEVVDIVADKTPEAAAEAEKVFENIKTYTTPSQNTAEEPVKASRKDGVYVDENNKPVENAFVQTSKGIVFTDDSGKKVTKTIVTVVNPKDGEVKQYYAGKNGYIAQNELVKLSDGTKIFAGEDGSLVKDTIVTDPDSGKKYYMNKDGKAETRTVVKVDGKKYYTGKSGAIQKNKLVTDPDGRMHYCTKSGELATSRWITIDDTKYWCNKNGNITKSKKIDE